MSPPRPSRQRTKPHRAEGQAAKKARRPAVQPTKTRRSGGGRGDAHVDGARRTGAKHRRSPPARPALAGTAAPVTNTGGVNSVTLIGRVAEPPEMRTGETGEEVCAMRLAVPRVARGGIREPGVVYVEVTTSGWQAHEIHEALSVGARIGVAGRIALEEWIDADGRRQSRYEVMADQLELLDPPPGGVAPGFAA